MPDGVQYCHFKNVCKDVAARMVKEHESICMRTNPDEWLHSNLSHWPKLGKDKPDLKGYCTVTMQNVHGRVKRSWLDSNRLI